MLELEALSKAHDREGFDCGSEPLNLFLKQTARQHAERGISKTFVLVEEEAMAPKPILGFYSLNICQLAAEELPPEIAKKFPRNVPGLKLGRLAVSRNSHRQGIGRVLLVAAMKEVVAIAEKAGGIGLFVDAKDETAKRYYEQFGFVPLPSNELQLFLPMKTIKEVLRE
ncbi:GNAT family N-acetyltransferase [Pedosphaera parvula]|uniref:GCN5-related N-acetyltransferase n=1 Tax=Pedosphaera parvula (strain Ellin514) TaxID=320771 RepID=B9XEF0_PEDPL|nr:GNAT family N-acetyltransferase [Pedosphaera parvula]EEF61664.1 GCN5-related N-acetyltransferase [Pedosphaera parvula Ellin514]